MDVQHWPLLLQHPRSVAMLTRTNELRRVGLVSALVPPAAVAALLLSGDRVALWLTGVVALSGVAVALLQQTLP